MMENDIWSNCKTFQPAKWGFVHIPEYHYTGEQVIISAIREDGGIEKFYERMLEGMGKAGILSPEFVSALAKHSLLNRYADGLSTYSSFAQKSSQEYTYPIISLKNCTERGTVVKFEDYYQTQWWRSLREHVIEQRTPNCCLCGGTESLQVHHKTYKRIGCESLQDLSVLCVTCHGLWHKAKKGADAYQKIQNFMTAFKELERSL